MWDKKKIQMGVGCLLAVALLTWLGVSIYNKSGPRGVIYAQLSALKAGDTPKAYAYTSTDFRSATTFNDFEDFVNHYPSIRDNKSASLNKPEVKDEAGVNTVTGTLTSKLGDVIGVEYTVVKEDGAWKVLGIQVKEEAATDQSSADSSKLTNVYDNKESHYSMAYPASWEYEQAGDGTIIFSGKRGSDAYFSTVNIQTVLSKKTGGDYASVKQFMTDIKHQATSQSPGVKFIESGPVEVVEKNGAKDQGEYTIFTYKYKGQEFKQWQVVVLRKDQQVFYAWAYTSPIARYETDLDIAKNMFKSWVIY